MRFPVKQTVVLTAAVCLNLPVIAYATNGLFQHGYGARQSGIAGSGVAFPQDPLIAAVNPAGVVFLDGARPEIDLQFFAPMREYTVGASAFSGSFPPFPGPTVNSGSEFFAIPAFGMAKPLGDEAAFGFALYGNGGMNTDWKAADTPLGVGTFGAGAVPGAITNTGVDYAQLFANFSYSRKFADGKASWGVSGLLNYSRIELKGLAAFAAFSTSPGQVTDQGYDTAFGVGARFGVQGQIGSGVTLAASYQTKISNTFDDYAGLFPNGGEMDIPPVLQAGLAANVGPGTLTLDAQFIQYTESAAIGNTSTGLPTGCVPARSPLNPAGGLTAVGASCLGAGLGFGWDDMTVFKVGYTWEAGSGWVWRVGASFGDQPVQESEVTINIIAPGVIEQHYTLGFSKKLANNREVSFSLMYAPEECVAGPDLFTPGQTVELCMHQYSVNAGFTF